jgi:hypothetical protein
MSILHIVSVSGGKHFDFLADMQDVNTCLSSYWIFE